MKDKKAEELEAKGLYRRAAKRWAEVMLTAGTDREQREAQAHHDRCVAAAKRPPQAFENFADVKQAATEAQIRMGIKPKDGRGFNDPCDLHRKKKQPFSPELQPGIASPAPATPSLSKFPSQQQLFCSHPSAGCHHLSSSHFLHRLIGLLRYMKL